MELAAFSDRVSIGVNLLCLHNEFSALNAAYYVLAEPHFFYRYFKNPYLKKYQLNVIGNLFRKEIARHPRIALFTSISNMFFEGMTRSFYLYHFGHRVPDRKVCDIAGAFSFMAGALSTALGLAINLGFRRATLVGCDYLFTPISDGHFYGVGPPRRSDRVENVYESLLAEATAQIDLDVITDGGVSRWLPYQDYESATGRTLRYRENSEIVRAEYLNELQRAVVLGQLTTQIYTAGTAQ